MKTYYRLMLGKGSKFAAECFEGGWIGAGFGIKQDLANDLPEAWREFNAKFIPVVLAANPGKTKIGAASRAARCGPCVKASRSATSC